MAIPTFEDIMLPLLKLASDNKAHSVNDAEKKLASHFDLSVEERKKEKASGRETVFFNRLRWARLYLKRAGLIFDPMPAYFRITTEGQNIINMNPPKIDTKFLQRFEDFKEWQKRKTNIKKILKKKEKKKSFKKKFGIVVFIDVLGTKGIWKRGNSRRITEEWNRFTTQFYKFIHNAMGSKVKINFNSFSDTIIITLEYQNVESLLLKFGASVWPSIVHSMILGMPVRGCFALGDFYHEGTFFIGPAIDEASQYYDLPQWIGISAAPSANRALQKLEQKKRSAVNTIYFKCDIPLKNSVEQDAWAVRWPDIADEFIPDYSNNVGRQFRNTLEVIDHNLENLTDVNASLKWRNTRKFYEDVIIRA